MDSFILLFSIICGVIILLSLAAAIVGIVLLIANHKKPSTAKLVLGIVLTIFGALSAITFVVSWIIVFLANMAAV